MLAFVDPKQYIVFKFAHSELPAANITAAPKSHQPRSRNARRKTNASSRIPFCCRGVHRLRDAVLQSESAYRKYLRLRFGAQFPPASRLPELATYGALKSEQQWQRALRRISHTRPAASPRCSQKLGYSRRRRQSSRRNSSRRPRSRCRRGTLFQFSPALYTYGYRHLTGINLAFKRTIQRGPIHYEPGDITDTRFADKFFDAAACLSVIEHGVDLTAFFTEMGRILKPNGLLMLSTDYWETPVDTAGKQDFATPSMSSPVANWNPLYCWPKSGLRIGRPHRSALCR